MTRHLIALGHRKIAFLGNVEGGRTTSEREKGFREELQASQIEANEEYIHLAPHSTPSGGYAATEYLLALPDRPTAIICYNDNMAVGVYGALYQAGLRVPQHMSVVGYDDIAIAAYLTPPLTTLRQFKFDLGSGAARMMLRILETRAESEEWPKPQKVGLSGELVVRASTASPQIP